MKREGVMFALKMQADELFKKLLDEVNKDGLRLESVPDALKTEQMCLTAVTQNWRALRFVPNEKLTVALCSFALRRSQSILCFDLIPKQILQEVKHRAGCYDFHAPYNRVISSIYNKA